MSNNNNAVVKDIYDNLSTIVQNTLGAEWKKLPRVFVPEANDYRSAEKGWGILRGSATPSDTQIKHYTLDHTHSVILTRSAPERMSDQLMQDAINDLYDKGNAIFVAALLSRLNTPKNVILVNAPEFDAPAILENGTVLLILNFNVKYRNEILL